MKNIEKVFYAISLIMLLLFPSGATGAEKEITTESGLEMVLIRGGEFEMNAPNEHSARVRVSSFYMGKYPVTQAGFERIMGTNPSRWREDNNPVESITWAGAAKYCNRLSRREGLQPVYDEETWGINYEADGYRLPTEAEWEYAARGGTDTEYFWGNDPGRLRFFAWVKDNSAGRTRPVGRKMPNPFGLYDLYGNVWEWCNDYYKEGYTPSENEKNPRGPGQGRLKVVRGGSWDSPPEEASSAFRGREEPGYADICTAAYDVYGFRVVKRAD